MNGKQILYHGLKICGMSRYYRSLHLTSDDLYVLEFYYQEPQCVDVLLCKFVRSILFDQVRELYQVLK